MTVNEALKEIDDAAQDVFDLHTRDQAKRKAGSRRNAYEKSLQEVRDVAGREEMNELKEWLIDRVRNEEKFPSGRETRKQGARILRDNGYSVPTGSWLGA